MCLNLFLLLENRDSRLAFLNMRHLAHAMYMFSFLYQEEDPYANHLATIQSDSVLKLLLLSLMWMLNFQFENRISATTIFEWDFFVSLLEREETGGAMIYRARGTDRIHAEVYPFACLRNSFSSNAISFGTVSARVGPIYDCLLLILSLQRQRVCSANSF